MAVIDSRDLRKMSQILLSRFYYSGLMWQFSGSGLNVDALILQRMRICKAETKRSRQGSMDSSAVKDFCNQRQDFGLIQSFHI